MISHEFKVIVVDGVLTMVIEVLFLPCCHGFVFWHVFPCSTHIVFFLNSVVILVQTYCLPEFVESVFKGTKTAQFIGHESKIKNTMYT